jgi:hypothetical protein
MLMKTLNGKTVGRRKRLPHVEQVGQALLPANSGVFQGALTRRPVPDVRKTQTEPRPRTIRVQPQISTVIQQSLA